MQNKHECLVNGGISFLQLSPGDRRRRGRKCCVCKNAKKLQSTRPSKKLHSTRPSKKLQSTRPSGMNGLDWKCKQLRPKIQRGQKIWRGLGEKQQGHPVWTFLGCFVGSLAGQIRNSNGYILFCIATDYQIIHNSLQKIMMVMIVQISEVDTQK